MKRKRNDEMKPYIPIEAKRTIRDLEDAETTNKHRLATTGTKRGRWRKKRNCGGSG